MKKRKKQLLLFTLLLNLAVPSQLLIQAENISPIESIDWGAEESESDEISESSQEEEVEEESSEASESVEGTPESSSELVDEEGESEATTTLDTSSPLTFLESLSQMNQRRVEYVNFLSQGDNVEMESQNTLVDGDKYYTARLVPPYLPQALFIQSDGEVVQEAHLSVDDLIKYAADALNTQPQIYEGTVVEEFYTFAQENYDELEGKVIEVDPTTNPIADSALEIIAIEDYLTEVALEWLGHEEVLSAFEANELGQQVLINDDLGSLFNEIAQAKQVDYPELADFFQVFTNVEGTINADYTNGVFGFGLLVPAADDNVQGLELYIGQSNGSIVDFSDDIIYSYEEFADFVGSDVVLQIQELEAGLTADQFQEVTE